ncbi:T9SS type A sorting domain-containing protein [uncultured Kordia sp.]|uniref:T9SS type A sorting domain-containing protein n=1 Tax=uncultured Kordia sp. TaxID=507699 RepID=UPI002604FAAD|nr:T9SS type A sorting domain-containing protein [uncultured Kordia sp.]
MKKQLLVSILYCFPIFFYGQISGIGEEFEDGISDWTNTDGSTTMLSQEMHSTPYQSNQYYLLKTCDGSNTAIGEMAVVYGYGGNFYDDTWGIGFDFDVKNDNNFPLHMRLGFEGSNNVELATINSVEVPAMSDWTHVVFWVEGGFDVEVTDEGDYVPSMFGIVFDTLSNVEKIRIIHNANVSFDGEIVTGTLQVDDFNIVLLLSTEEKFLNDIQIFPNPVNDLLFINFPHAVKGKLTITSIDGKQLLTKELKAEQMQLDLSNIKSKGIYFLKIETPKGTITKKIIKA